MGIAWDNYVCRSQRVLDLLIMSPTANEIPQNNLEH